MSTILDSKTENSVYIKDVSLHKSRTTKSEIFYNIVWLFVIGCVIGYVVEVGYAYIRKGHFVNKQGMIYGPFNQVYGLGSVLFMISLGKLQKQSSIIIFLISTFIGTAFEYVCSFLQEVVFGSVSWQYDKFPLNLNGRINIMHSLYWGILGVLAIKIVFPFLFKKLNKVPKKIMLPITWFVAAFMVFNMSISGLAVYRQKLRMDNIEPRNKIESFLDKHYPDEYLKKVYPGMKFVE